MASGTIEMDIIIIIKELKFWHVHVWIHVHLRTWALYEDYIAVQIWPHDLRPPLLQSPLHVTPLIPGSILNWQCSSSFQCFRQRGSWHLAQRCLQSRCELRPSFSPWQCPCHWRWLRLCQTLWVPLPWQICKCWKCVCVHHVNPLGPRPAAALSQRNPLWREVTVSNDPGIQLKKSIINTKQKFQRTLSIKKKSQVINVHIWMSGFWGLWGNQLQNFQFESPKMKLCEFVRVPIVSDWAIFAVQIWKDEAPMPLLIVGLLFILGHLSRVHLATLKIHSVSQTSPNFKQRTSPEVVNNSGNEGTSQTRILFLFA